MFKHIVRSFIGMAFIFSISCSKKVKEDKEAATDAGKAGSISSESMNFNAAGSDSSSISGLNTVNFAYDSSALDEKARELLKNNAAWIKTNNQITIQIEGHCDSRGSVEYNLALGQRRAEAVKVYLTNLGVESKRMTIISYGKEKPLEIGDTEEIYAKNRRANFVPLAN